MREEIRIADQIAEQHGDRTAVSYRIGYPLFIELRGHIGAEGATAPAAILLADLVRKAAIVAGCRQYRAAGRTEFASRSVFQVAFSTAHGFGFRLPRK